MKLIPFILRILLLLILAAFGVGYYFRWQDDPLTGDRIIGIGVLTMAFVLMPLFIWHRSRGKKLEDYMFNQKNWDQMNNKKGNSSDNQ